jgi:hypothetical protein
MKQLTIRIKEAGWSGFGLSGWQTNAREEQSTRTLKSGPGVELRGDEREPSRECVDRGDADDEDGTDRECGYEWVSEQRCGRDVDVNDGWMNVER